MTGVALLLAMALPAAAFEDATRHALQQGDCRRALADTPAPGHPEEALAKARCAVAAGRVDEALTLLQPVTTSELRGYGALVAAEALLGRGEPAQAAARLDGVALPGPAGDRATLVRGRALVESGDPLAGRDTLRPLLAGALADPGAVAEPGGASPAEVRWWLAEGAVRRGETAAAIPVWQSIWARNPLSPQAEDAAAQLAAAGAPVPDPTTHAGRVLIHERIGALEKRMAWVEALAMRDLLPDDDAAKTPSKMARAAFRAKDYPRAVALFGAMPTRTPEQAFDYALGTSRTGDYARAAERYALLIASHPGHRLAETADFKLGYLAYDGGDLGEAIARFTRHLQTHPRSGNKDEALWFIGWAQYRLGRLGEANETFERLLREAGGSSLASGARYWQARIAAAKGDATAERAGYEDVLRRWPASGHGWFAAWRLGKTYTGRKPEPAPAPPASLDRPAYRRGAALARVGLGGWAQAELQDAADGVARSDTVARWALAHTLLEAGAYPLARKVAPCPASGVSGLPMDQVAVCLPRPMGDVPARQALAGGLPRNLPYAIMTAESALTPDVSSPAGARGLMQLMPDLAADLHRRRYGDQPYDPDLLFQPGYNAALGVDELSGLHRNLVGAGVDPALPLVIAGYNGGEAAVRRWLGGYETPPEPDRFAEDISYTETRRYVKRVLGYLQLYRMTYGDG